jgi:hypothetical protein
MILKYYIIDSSNQGRIQDFKLGGRTSKNCAERREARNVLGYFVWKITILRQKNLTALIYVRVSVLAASVVDRGFEPWSVQIKDYKIGICWYPTVHEALRSKSKDWL